MKLAGDIILIFFFITQMIFMQGFIKKFTKYSAIQPIRFINVSTDYTLGTTYGESEDISVDRTPLSCEKDKYSTQCLIDLENQEVQGSNYGDSYNKIPSID